MAQMLVLYKTAADAAAFTSYYFGTHVPLAKKIPGLLRYDVSEGPVAGPGGASYQLIATLTFESIDALQRGMRSPEGRAAGADVSNFAQAGVELLTFETRTV